MMISQFRLVLTNTYIKQYITVSGAYFLLVGCAIGCVTIRCVVGCVAECI